MSSSKGRILKGNLLNPIDSEKNVEALASLLSLDAHSKSSQECIANSTSTSISRDRGQQQLRADDRLLTTSRAALDDGFRALLQRVGSGEQEVGFNVILSLYNSILETLCQGSPAVVANAMWTNQNTRSMKAERCELVGELIHSQFLSKTLTQLLQMFVFSFIFYKAYSITYICRLIYKTIHFSTSVPCISIQSVLI